ATPPAKGEDSSTCRLLTQDILCQHRKALNTLPHVCDAAGKINPNAGARSNHACSTARMSRVSTVPSTWLPKQSRRPQRNCNSTIEDEASTELFASEPSGASVMSTGRNKGSGEGGRSPFLFNSLRHI